MHLMMTSSPVAGKQNSLFTHHQHMGRTGQQQKEENGMFTMSSVCRPPATEQPRTNRSALA
jgi:hypothetical protein